MKQRQFIIPTSTDVIFLILAKRTKAFCLGYSLRSILPYASLITQTFAKCFGFFQSHLPSTEAW